MSVDAAHPASDSVDDDAWGDADIRRIAPFVIAEIERVGGAVFDGKGGRPLFLGAEVEWEDEEPVVVVHLRLESSCPYGPGDLDYVKSFDDCWGNEPGEVREHDLPAMAEFWGRMLVQPTASAVRAHIAEGRWAEEVHALLARGIRPAIRLMDGGPQISAAG